MTSKQERIKGSKRNTDTSKRLLACLVCGLLAASLWWLPVVRDLLLQQDRKLKDAWVKVDSRITPREDFVFLGIDSASMGTNGVGPSELAGNKTLQMMQGQYPWDRRVYADAIERLANSGAKLILIDIVFAQQATPEEDAALAEVIARHRDKVVLVSAFSPLGTGGGKNAVQVVEPIEPFLGPLENETTFGYANFWPQYDDGIVRTAHFKMTSSEANQAKVHPDEPVYLSLAAAAASKLGKEIPSESKRFRMGIRDAGLAVNSYEPLSLYTIFAKKEWKSNYQDGEFFRDKIVIIGPAAPMFHDSHMTVGGKIYGAQLHLHVLAALLDETWYNDVFNSYTATVVLCLLGLLLSSIVVVRYSKTVPLSIAGVLFWFVMACLMLSLLYIFNLLFGGLGLVMTFSAGIFGAIIWQAMTERARRQQLHRHLQRSMSPDVADAIVQAPDGYYRAASGNRREVTVLFADVRGFTNRSEQQDAAELVSQLNEYLGRMVEVIFSHGGSVDKFIGDAIMATWGVIEETGSEADSKNAVDAAQKMLSELKILNAEWIEKGLEPFRIGVGLHRGEAIVGEVGSDQRTDFTVIGDSVNLASRIEGMTKAMGVELLISSSVSDQLKNKSHWLNVGMVRVKGKEEGVALWTTQQGSADEMESFQSAMQLFQAGEFSESSKLLEKVTPDSALTGLADFYQQQVNHLTKNPAAAEGWSGVLKMDTK